MGGSSVEQVLHSPQVTVQLLTYLVVVSSATFVLLNLFETGDEESENPVVRKFFNSVEYVTWGVGIGIGSYSIILFLQILAVFDGSGTGEIGLLLQTLHTFGIVGIFFSSTGFAILMAKIGRAFSRYRMRITWKEQ